MVLAGWDCAFGICRRWRIHFRWCRCEAVLYRGGPRGLIQRMGARAVSAADRCGSIRWMARIRRLGGLSAHGLWRHPSPYLSGASLRIALSVAGGKRL